MDMNLLAALDALLAEGSVTGAGRRLGLSASAVGVTLGAYGVGMVCGALAAPAVARRIAFGRMLLVGPFCGLAASLVMVGTLAVPSFWLAASSFFLLGAGRFCGPSARRRCARPSRPRT